LNTASAACDGKLRQIVPYKQITSAARAFALNNACDRSCAEIPVNVNLAAEGGLKIASD
jgi:hypothetical protein